MTTVSPESFLLDQFPKTYWPPVPTILKGAYDAVDDLAADQPILQVESARDNKGRLITWATDLAFVKAIETGQLPFDYRWRPFAKPTGRYLEIRLAHSVLTISQVADARKQPRNVQFRENGRLNNEPFFDLPEFSDEQELRGLPHFLLIHGHQSLAFAHLAVPHSQHKRNYRYRSPNLMRLPHEVPQSVPAVEDTDADFEARELLKEEIEKWRRDNGAE